MIFQNLDPCKALQEYVNLYRIRHFVIPPGMKPFPKPYPPHPEQCIIFYPRGAETVNFAYDPLKVIRPRSVIAGQYTRRIDRVSLNSEIIIILVVFKPGALHRLTGIPFSLLIDQVVDLEAVYPKKAREVNNRLGSCENLQEMIGIIELFLIELTASPKIPLRRTERIFDYMLRNTSNCNLDWLAREACLSIRQFERQSRDYVGVSPKYFARIARFSKTYYLGIENLRPNWLDVSINFGYNDYQHLVRDYKEFTNSTPKGFLVEESRSLERALGLR
ncbi:AraC family transcriptional regulator [Gramella sp. GC03-9]|uniref:AraC family transcriptional regulator n=1 Tax=Christiangramia oceanisediminis TaxID=2920386 RepID=A0A9X2I054_9FLAO|nr:helix-turn-helix domain-containing protein [Gramella oceanisediminis]MCP9198829.1 AraC family transcriptional regulator [Gramella oceanisediminis]